jgi:ATP-dependent Lhr-like helicase
MPLEVFYPLIRDWFRERFGEPTEPQQLAWPPIAAGEHTLIAAPTGSGKTLAAFLVCLDRLWRTWLAGNLEDRCYVVYVSPLKALSNDIDRNLQAPLAELRARAEAEGLEAPPIRTAVRTGDTPAKERQAMLKNPPHIIVTTPESLYLLLTSAKSRELLRSVDTVIVDEIHALARDKRGSHLALTLQRLDALCERPPVRIGLSATQRPIDKIARFLVGSKRGDDARPPDCRVIDVGHVRELDLALEVPASELSAVCSHEQWAEIYQRLTTLVMQHRSTLIFVNTRRLAERAAMHLTELLGADAVASHHGSLSKEIRQSAERRLKSGELKAIVATASLELGIDIGYIDLVCQIGSPRSIATFLQRIGRSGHSLGKIPKGRLFPLTRDELLECMSLVRAVHAGRLDQIEIPQQPLDILAQQLIASVACEEWDEAKLYELCRGAWPYRNLSPEDYQAVLKLVSEGVAPNNPRGAYLHRDQIGGRLRARRGARLAAITSGGAIPETAQFRVLAEPEGTFVGTLDEDFAIESLAGDVFVLGNTSWRIRHVRGGEVIVRDAQGAPPSVPFWLGEAPGRTVELSAEVSRLRADLAARAAEVKADDVDPHAELRSWLLPECGAPDWAAEQAIAYVEAQLAAVGSVPTQNRIMFERFFDESGGMQLVIHAPLGARMNRAWGLALRKRFCRSFDFELQASADDNGIVLSLGPQHSFPLEQMFQMLNADNIRPLLEQALLAVPMFQVRWRWNLTRSLAVLRMRGGRKVPPQLQRFYSDDLLAAVFPEQVGCLENHSGDVVYPDHPLVQQTLHDCLTEAMDLAGLTEFFRELRGGGVTFQGYDTREPSPFCYELLNANPYAFLDDAPLEERRTRAVATRRTLSSDQLRDLARLDPAAIAQVAREAWPLVRSADELHEALMGLVTLGEGEQSDWQDWFKSLVSAGRATRVVRPGCEPCWIAAERWPILAAAFPDAVAEPEIVLPPALQKTYARSEAWVELVRGRIQHSGPMTAASLAEQLGLETSQAASALEALEGTGLVMRGRFTEAAQHAGASDAATIEWCERRLLARIHRMTLDGLRKQIQSVEPAQFMQFLTHHQHVEREQTWGGAVGVREAIAQLQGFELPAGAWEQRVLATRVGDYDPQWLDHLFLSGEVVWGRLSPPVRGAEEGPSMAAMTRSVPISLVLREDLPGLLSPERTSAAQWARPNAELVLRALTDRGALFFNDLVAVTGLLPSHLEEALRELAALGLVTSDAFAAVRKIVEHKHTGRRRPARGRMFRGLAAPIGRWSLFPGPVASVTREQYLQQWCRQLLRRYGIVFRELLVRESSAPSWFELVPQFRSMELRGEVRGGRFVAQVAGEQYATEAAVQRVREIRDRAAPDAWVAISAADPLNLLGIVLPGTRLPATHRNALILEQGNCLATQQASQVEFLAAVPESQQWEMRRALQLGRRPRKTVLDPLGGEQTRKAARLRSARGTHTK